MSALGQTSTTAAPSSVPPTVSASTTSAGAPVTGSVPSAVPSSSAVGSSSGTDPVVALDHLAGALENQSAESQSIFDKAKDIAVPYLNKAQETTTPYLEKIKATTTPYVDKAVASLEHLADKVEAKLDGTAASTSSTTLGDNSAVPATGSSSSTLGSSSSSSTLANPERRASIVDQIGDKVEGVFASVSNSFSKLTTTIDDKTKSGTQPGLVTQLTQAVERVGEKVDSYLDGTPAQHPSVAAHPVQTTTNTVPHPTTASDPSTSTKSALSSTGIQTAGHSSSGPSASTQSSSGPSTSTGSSSFGPSSSSATASQTPASSGSASKSSGGDNSEFSGGAGVAEVTNKPTGSNADPEIDSRF